MEKEYKVRITMKEVFECYVTAEDEEVAETAAYQKHVNGDTELVYDGLDYEVEEQDA